MDIEVL